MPPTEDLQTTPFGATADAPPPRSERLAGEPVPSRDVLGNAQVLQAPSDRLDPNSEAVDQPTELTGLGNAPDQGGGPKGPPAESTGTDLVPGAVLELPSPAGGQHGSGTDVMPGASLDPGPASEDDSEIGEPAFPGAGDYVTYPQVAWGAPATSEAGAYRDAHFASAFAQGLAVGCAAGYLLELESAAAVEALLPQAAPPAPLASDEQDPKTSSAGALAGEVVALTLAVAFDALDAPTDAGVGLGGLVLTQTTCGGMTVNQVLGVANAVLGTCRGDWSAALITGCVRPINEAYAGGATATKLLRLP